MNGPRTIYLPRHIYDFDMSDLNPYCDQHIESLDLLEYGSTSAEPRERIEALDEPVPIE